MTFKKLPNLKGRDGKPIYSNGQLFVTGSSTAYVNESYVWLETETESTTPTWGNGVKHVKENPELYLKQIQEGIAKGRITWETK